jgi:hypothetical protein
VIVIDLEEPSLGLQLNAGDIAYRGVDMISQCDGVLWYRRLPKGSLPVFQVLIARMTWSANVHREAPKDAVSGDTDAILPRLWLPLYGLIIRSTWIEKILDGTKT